MQSGRPRPESIRDATLNTLRRAAENGLESVAFPALGTDVGGFALDAAAREMARAVHDYEDEQPDTSVASVIFVLRDEASLREFRRGMG